MSIDCNKEANHTVKYIYFLRLFCTYTFFIAILLSILACKTNQHSDPPKLLVGTASSLEYLFEDLVDDFESENNLIKMPTTTSINRNFWTEKCIYI